MYLSASEAVFHEEALYQVYLPLPLPFTNKQESNYNDSVTVVDRL